jgi:hypothetical protein
VTMKNAIFWDVAPCGSYKNRHLMGTYRLHRQNDTNRRARNNVSSNEQTRHTSWSRRYVPPKHRFLQEPHGVTSQMTAFFIVTAVKTSNLT